MSPNLPDAPFLSRDAARLGTSRKQLRNLVAGRSARQVLRGVYVSSSTPNTLEMRVSAVRLVLPPFAFVCDRTAAFIHGIDTHGPLEHPEFVALETCVLPCNAPLRRIETRGRTRDLLPRDVQRFGDVPVTSPLRTALDLACGLDRFRALMTLDQFLHRGQVTSEELIAEIPRYQGRRGVVQLRELCTLADGLAESTGESWMRLLLVDNGLPTPELQVWVEDEFGRPLYRLDLAYKQSKVAVEYDGELFHRTDGQRQRDEARRTWLRARGWIVIVVTKDRLAGPARDALIKEVREALLSRSGR